MKHFLKIFSWTSTALCLAVAGFVLAVITHDVWQGWIPGHVAEAEAQEDQHAHAHGDEERIRLSAEARKNMGLVVETLKLRTEEDPYPRSIQLLGKVVERPGESDRGITAPFAGIVTGISKVPGEVVHPGDELFTLQLTSEYLQEAQAKLYKTALDLEINQRERRRLSGDGERANQNNLFRARLIELGYESDRLTAALKAYRQELRARLLPLFNDVDDGNERERRIQEQIAAIEKEGRLITEVAIKAPNGSFHRYPYPVAEVASTEAVSSQVASQSQKVIYEVEDLKVWVGDQVSGGQSLCRLSNHAALYLEGQAFEQDVPLLQRAIRNGWTIRADFLQAGDEERSRQKTAAADSVKSGIKLDKLQILYISNRLDPATRTFPFYVLLPNQAQKQVRPDTGKSYLLWRFRLDQPARLNLQVDEFANVFVLPSHAVAREGPDAYVFRARVYQEEGEIVLERKPVHVLHEDSRNVVIANDGNVIAGSWVAHNAAAQLNRVLKAQLAGGEAGGHVGHSHAGHMH